MTEFPPEKPISSTDAAELGPEAPPSVPEDPAPWRLKGAIIVTALSLIGQIVLFILIGGAASLVIALLEPGILDHPAEMQDAVILISVAPVALLSSLLTVGLVYVSITAIYRRPFFASLRLSRPSGPSLAGYTALGYGVAVAYVAVSSLFPMPETSEPEGVLSKLAQSGTTGHIIWAVMALGLAPVAEEILFRGYAYLGARQKLGPVWAGVLVTSLFVPLHMGETGTYWPALAGIATLSTILILVIERTGNLSYCIACHLGYNAALASLSLVGGG